MLIKKIGTSNIGKAVPGQDNKRQDDTTSLESLRNSLGSGNTLARGLLLEGRYEVEQVIGYGGMSTVYRARDTRFTQTVRVCAIKEMFDVSTDPLVRQDKLKRFEEEANFLALLNHPAIPKIYDFFAAHDRRYLVLEYIEGKNLETMLEENNAPLNEVDVLNWAAQLCEVLSYLHNHKPQPIVFRDMKPSNVMLTNEDRLVLIDFGIAKTFQEDKKGTMIGTEGYSPPEQYKGMALPAGDIYALGATMHHLLTNNDPRIEVPFTFHERMPVRLNPKITPATEAVIMKALEFDIAKRWANVEKFEEALLEVYNRLAPASSLKRPSNLRATPDTVNIKTEQTRSVNSPSTSKNGAVQTGKELKYNPTFPRQNVTANSNRQSQTAQADVVEQVGPPEDLAVADLVWSFKCEEEIRGNPVVSNSKLFVGCYDSNLYALDAKRGSFLWKAPTGAGICATPCVTDRLVVVGSEDSSLYALDLVNGQLVWITRTAGPIRSSARFFSPMLFFGSDDQHIYCVEARTGKQVWKQRTWGPVRSSPIMVAGTVYIGSMDGHLYALDGNNGNIRWKFRALEGINSSPVYQDNMLYIGSQDGNIYCIDNSSSWAIWKFKTNSYVSSSPAIAQGRVYVGSVDGYMYCIDARKGRLIWKFNTGRQITSSPRVLDGVVYFGGVDGNLYALDAENGQPRWYYPTQGPITSSPFIEEGKVYIGSIDYNIYALNTCLSLESS